MLKVEKLVKAYQNKKVVNEISFELEKGEILALLGKSGCGKTTTLKMINRLIEPSSGSIFINNKNILSEDVHQLRRHMGYVIQENGLFPHYTVAQNISIVPKLLGYDEGKITDIIPEVLTQLELPLDFQHKFPHELSGGQQQRVAIARAIATKPPLLLMDEPFSALDPITRSGVRERFITLSKQFDMTTVVVTHDVAEAIEMADVICLMNDGRIEQLGNVRNFLFQPKNDFVKTFFDTNRLEIELKALTIREVLPHTQLNDQHQSSMPYPIHTSLYELFEQSHTTTAIQLIENDQTIGYTTKTALFQAYTHYKNSTTS
ncbi:MAG: ATP-binding cassette domain-containing protein [Flammeovirgaceae bacterium]